MADKWQALTSFYINRYHFSKNFWTWFKSTWKKIFITNFPFLWRFHSNPTVQHCTSCVKKYLRDDRQLLRCLSCDYFTSVKIQNCYLQILSYGTCLLPGWIEAAVASSKIFLASPIFKPWIIRPSKGTP